MVSQQHRLRALQMCVTRNRGLADFLCPIKQHTLHCECLVDDHAYLALGEQAEVGCDLIIPATSGMQFCAGWTSKLGYATFNSSMDVFVGRNERERFITEFTLDCIERRQHRRTLFLGKNSRSGETTHMRARTSEVVDGKPRVEWKTHGEGHQFLCWSAFEPAVPERAHESLLSVGGG
jgi:hypothetical protein